MASFMTPLNAQWNLAYSGATGQFNGFYFVDSLNGWFTQDGLDRIIYTSDGGFNFDVQNTPSGTYGLRDIYMETPQIGWAAGNANGGQGKILYTANGGITWIQMSNPAPSPCAWNCIAKSGNIMWFAGGYSPNGGIDYYGIIMKTSDSGQNWQYNLYPAYGPIGNIKVLDDQNILITGSNIRRTTNSGSTWFDVTQNSDPDYCFYRFTFVNLYFGYSLGGNPFSGTTDLYVTTDGGFTWNLHYNFGPQTGQKMALSVVPQTGTIFVGGWLSEIYPYKNGLIRSTNNGATWDTVFVNLCSPTYVVTPDPRHGWASVGPYIYRYDYVPPQQITRSITLNAGWNLISMPVDAENDSVIVNFPFLQGNAYGFNGSYNPAYTLQNGKGYWVKYPNADTVSPAGVYIESIGFNVPSPGWTMIGSVSDAVGLNSLFTIPPGSIAGNVYKFENGSYQIADSLKPGFGYWIKLTQPCNVIIDSSP
jgi:photosystem II stability/assembly factor-like uncharacterized protein